MTRTQLFQKLKIVLFFGLLTVILGHMLLNIPGSMGVKSNFAEIGLLTSLPYMTNMYMAFGVSLFTIFNVTSDGSIFPETINHIIGFMFMFFAYRQVRKVKKTSHFVIIWCGLVTIYYFVFLIPIIYLVHYVNGTISLHEMILHIGATSTQVHYEWIITTAMTIFYFLTRKNYEERKEAQNKVLELNKELQKNIDKLNQMLFIDSATGLPNSLQFEKDFAELLEMEKKKKRYTLFGFRLYGYSSLSLEKGLEYANQHFSNFMLRFQELHMKWLNSHIPLFPPAIMKPCYRINETTMIFLLDMTLDESEHMEEIAMAYQKILLEELDKNQDKSLRVFQGGVTSYPEDGELATLLTRNLLNLLYSKRNAESSNFVPFNPDIYKTYVRREKLRQNFEEGIANGEFYYVFQPKIQIQDNYVIGFEALARWNSPHLGLISPYEFIPIAEKYHYIDQLTRALLTDVYCFCNELTSRSKKNFRISINISSELLNKEFLEFFYEEIEKRNIFHLLEIEITESVIADLSPMVMSYLHKLKKAGMSIAIDDFGTGYSNLSYLQKIEADVLKIDKSFIDGILLGDKNCKLVEAISDIASTLGMIVVAEGVEQKEQKDFLSQIGCDIIQGYFYSKPLEFKDAVNFTAGLDEEETN